MKVSRMVTLCLAALLMWNFSAPAAKANSLVPGMENVDDLDDWPTDDDDMPDEENDYESELEREDADFIPDDIEVDVDDDDEFSSDDVTHTLSSGGSIRTKTANPTSSVASGSKSGVATQDGMNRLVYPKGKAYGVRVAKNAKVHSKVEGGRVVFALRKNDRVMRVGGLQKDGQGKIWARVTLLGGRMGYIPYSALAKGGARVQSSGKIYAATMEKSVYICDENGFVYKNAVLRKGVDIAVKEKVTANEMEWYILAGIHGLEKRDDSSMFLVPAEAVSWSKGEPKDIQ